MWVPDDSISHRSVTATLTTSEYQVYKLLGLPASHPAATALLRTTEQICGESFLILACYHSSLAWLPSTHKHLVACKEDTGRSHNHYRFASIPHHQSAHKTALFRATRSLTCHEEDATPLPLLAQVSRYRRNFSSCASGMLSFPVCVSAYNNSEYLL
jgi:hypothetical protein